MPGGSSEDDEDPPTTAAGHIQFLDLTNGTGGERPPDEDDEVYEDEEGDEEDDGGHSGSAAVIGTTTTAMGGAPTVTALRSSGATVLPDPTPGRVVETGQEHTGRWTKEEHEAFLAALQKYGKEWKKVAAKVKTRTVVQTRTHAQKYFQKLQKSIEQKGGDEHAVGQGLDMPEPRKVASFLSHQQQGSSRGKKKEKAMAMPKPLRRGSAATMSAAQVISTLSNAKPGGAFVATASSSSFMNSSTPPRHGFSVDTDTTTFPSPYGTTTAAGWRPESMKIVAPDPSDARHKFPEPSPAATGKRKLAEIAAARMLAGVGALDGPPTPPLPPAVSGSGGGGLNLKDAPTLPLFGGGNRGLSLQIVNPESLGVTHYSKKKSGECSPVTPWDGELEALVTTAAEKAIQAAADEEDDKLSCDSVPTKTTAALNIHPVNGPADAYERTPLHQAVCSEEIADLQIFLGVVKGDDLQRLDEAGYCPLHSASAMLMKHGKNGGEIESVPNQMVRMLLAAGADPARQDSKGGNSPLHWAARAGDRDAAEQLLKKGAGGQDAKNLSGETPLHWAMRAGMQGAAVVALLLENGARPGILDKSFRRPIDVASDGFVDDEGSLAAMKLRDNQGKKMSAELQKMLKWTARDRRDARANLLIRSAHSRTLVLHHPECLEHHTKSQADWEAPDRVKTIMRRILPSSDPTGATETSGIFPHEVTVSQEFDRANLDLLSRVHSTEYLSFVNKLSKDLERKVKETGGASAYDTDQGTWSPPPQVVPFTPMVQRSMIKIDESSVKLSDNSDTSFSAGSLRAARRAAGAVQHAVDCVLLGRNRNAFCAVRPPGHHAGVNGLLEGGESCGFCIFNNVAAGALHAISDDKLLCERCAIVDIDVHHGNGTEEIVRKCSDPSKLFFFSIHLYDNDKTDKKRSSNQFAYKFYPGTGSKDDLAMNIINVPIMPLWKDFSSASAPAKTHNTRKKVRSAQETTDDSSEPSTPRISSRASDVASDTGSSNANAPSPRHASAAPPGRMAYRQAIQNRLLPALRAFNPDLILISAGFDASKGDVGNARHEKGRERMGLDLEPEDYAWTTRKILEIADICCQGRVVSVLEGGYGRTPAAPAVDGMAQSLDRSVFGECAIRHLHAMIDPYDAENRFAS